jgi:hypothetical protein
VQVSIDGFSPSSVTIAPGDAVYWMVVDDMGPYTISSTSGAWGPRYLYDAGDTDGLQFNQTGDFFYYDAFNSNDGVVHVRPSVPNLPPSVTIASPHDGAIFIAPASFAFEVNAFDLDDGLSDVEFYVGADWWDDVFDIPFSTSVTNLAAGSYVLQAIAYDFSGATATNSVSITVQSGSAPRITLSAPRLVSGQFQFDVSGLTAGKQVVLQSATSLAASGNWLPLQTNTVNISSTTLSQAVLPGNHFFRVLQLP